MLRLRLGLVGLGLTKTWSRALVDSSGWAQAGLGLRLLGGIKLQGPPRASSETHIHFSPTTTRMGRSRSRGATLGKVSGSWSSMHSAPFGMTYTLYRFARHCLPAIVPANAQPTPSPMLASACQRSWVSMREIVHAASGPHVSVSANVTHGCRVSVLLPEDVPWEWVAIGVAPSIVSPECSDDWWT